MTRESKVKQLQVMDSTRRQLMNYTQQQKETELARLDDDIRRKVWQDTLLYSNEVTVMHYVT